DTAVRWWEVASGTHVRTLTGRPGGVNSVAFSPDGTLIAFTGAGDKAVRLWEVATRRKVHKLTGHTDSVRGVAFSPDGTLLASGGDDKTGRVGEAGTRAHGRTAGRRTRRAERRASRE